MKLTTAVLSTLVLILGFSCNTSYSLSCNFNLWALPTWKSVSSPEFPKKFPSQTQCSWRITAPHQFRIHLELTSFELTTANRNNQCIWQWLNIVGDGSERYTPESSMLTLCGNNKPRLVISFGNSLTLNLHSNAAAGRSYYRGFSARYKTTSASPYFPDISNILPDNIPSPVKMDSSPTIKTLGEVLAPFVKKRRPKPKSPNAVQALRNQRTELANRDRNNAANGMSSADTSFADNRRPLRSTRSPMTTLNSNILRRDELPPRRSKPLPRDIKILLSVLGVVGAIILVLYIAKKFAYDKVHKKKSGRIMHACSHFRRFQKRKKGKEAVKDDVETVCGVGTKTSQSSESGVGTMKANELDKNEMLQINNPVSNTRSTEDTSGTFGVLEEGFKNNVPVKHNHHDQFSMGLHQQNTQKISKLPESVRYSYPSDSSSFDEESYKPRRQRRQRRRKESDLRTTRQNQFSDRSTGGRSQRRCDNSSVFGVRNSDTSKHNQRSGTKQTRTKDETWMSGDDEISKMKSNITSNDDHRPSKSSTWRDRAYA